VAKLLTRAMVRRPTGAIRHDRELRWTAFVVTRGGGRGLRTRPFPCVVHWNTSSNFTSLQQPYLHSVRHAGAVAGCRVVGANRIESNRIESNRIGRRGSSSVFSQVCVCVTV